MLTALASHWKRRVVNQIKLDNNVDFCKLHTLQQTVCSDLTLRIVCR